MANIGTTNVPGIVWGDTGPVIPSGPAVLAGVQADYNVSFSVTFNFNLNTPQGQLTSTTAAVINNANQFWAWLVTQVDPAYAMGRMQDAIARIYFLERNPSEPTVVPATCTGGEGVVIPVGALAIAEDGNIYSCTEEGTIPAIGFIDLPFACNTVGPIECPADSLNEIYQAIPGWDTITNAEAGVTGNDTESRADFEIRRAASVAQNSRNTLLAIQGAVLAVENVLDAYCTENPLDVPATIGGVSLAANSLYVAAVGGLAQEVGDAIFSKKAPGCAYNGNTTVTVTVTEGYSPPYPTYSVKFQTPAALEILFAVNIVNSALVPADAATQIQDAIIAAFAGEDGGSRARIGATIYATRFIAPVAALGSWVQIISLLVGSTNTANATFTGSISGTALTASGITGTIAAGQTVSGTGVTVGTKIVSGSGGSWVVSNSQTVASTTMKTAKATLNDEDVNIDQVPTIDAANITVTVS